MEGLIPMVYKSLKKSKTRRKYECLSSGSGAAQAYNIADFYVKDNINIDHHHDYLINSTTKDQDRAIPGHDKFSGLSGPAHHRRCNSVHVVDRARASFGLEEEEPARPKQQLVRFRSHRMFSCVTGA